MHRLIGFTLLGRACDSSRQIEHVEFCTRMTDRLPLPRQGQDLDSARAVGAPRRSCTIRSYSRW
jgi:hypothetical protein